MVDKSFEYFVVKISGIRAKLFESIETELRFFQSRQTSIKLYGNINFPRDILYSEAYKILETLDN